MPAKAAYEFDFSAGELCLDFVNTLGDRPIRKSEHLSAWRDLLAWAEQARLVSEREAAAIVRCANRRPAAAARVFGRALTTRETLYRIFAAAADRRAPAAADLALLNKDLAGAMAQVRLDARAGRITWGWDAGDASLERLLWPVVRSAAELLVSGDLARVRECASATCSWLFLDRSPTRRRRWCSMKTCGNRDKVRRFYARQRDAHQ